mgnify:CR=1 FL=1
MLLFIYFCSNIKHCGKYFNTSHVTVYPRVKMFLLKVNLFQYISCYCLSGKNWKMHLTRYNFNTSHVTVYPNRCLFNITSILFQYISCYCLSYWYYEPVFLRHISIHLMLLFILQAGRSERAGHISIHLMLLFIEVFGGFDISKFLHFNTSHVTVYLRNNIFI